MMTAKKADNTYQPNRAKRVPTVKHEHAWTLPRNGRKGCALCPAVQPREHKFTLPENMKQDRNAKAEPYPTPKRTQENTAPSTTKVEPSTTASSTTESTEDNVDPSNTLTAEQLWAMNVPALYRLATTKKVRGRSTMGKAELIQALL